MGGSHKAFLNGWTRLSCHDWTILSLPATKWKWRMRHGAITFARQVDRLVAEGHRWDALFCSDMLNLAEFLGLVDKTIRNLPKVIYFHENQLTYPVRVESERDYQYAMTNLTGALAADSVWFNSAFHRDEFLDALSVFLKRMPDYQPLDAVDMIRGKSVVHPPAIDMFGRRRPEAKTKKPLSILWAARWEHDKNPDDFFAAMKMLKDKGHSFRLSVIGEQFRDQPEVFDRAKEFFAEHIDRWGYQKDRHDYRAALSEADIFVSTANHEFFGISAIEAIAAGAHPVLPRRLAYPEIIDSIAPSRADELFYDGTVDGLVDKLATLLASGNIPRHDDMIANTQQRYAWQERAELMDKALEEMC
jgi:glycosyltransferase involved in cell wall biosynthesis